MAQAPALKDSPRRQGHHDEIRGANAPPARLWGDNVIEPDSIEIPHLETFCKAAELLNFTAAAEVLCLTQAAVSQRIKALEQDVGQSLFERQAGRVFLSEVGRRLYDYAQKILLLHRQARQGTGRTA